MNAPERPFSAAKATAIGARNSNEDRCFFLDGGDTLLMGVADGLGGHPRGDVAAQVDELAALALTDQPPQVIHVQLQQLRQARQIAGSGWWRHLPPGSTIRPSKGGSPPLALMNWSTPGSQASEAP